MSECGCRNLQQLGALHLDTLCFECVGEPVEDDRQRLEIGLCHFPFSVMEAGVIGRRGSRLVRMAPASVVKMEDIQSVMWCRSMGSPVRFVAGRTACSCLRDRRASWGPEVSYGFLRKVAHAALLGRSSLLVFGSV